MTAIAWNAISTQLTGSIAIPLAVAIEHGWHLSHESLHDTTAKALCAAYRSFSWANLDAWDQQDAIQGACLHVLHGKLQCLEFATDSTDLMARWHVCFRDSLRHAMKSIVRARLPTIEITDGDSELDIMDTISGGVVDTVDLESKAEEAFKRAMDSMPADMVVLVELLMEHAGDATQAEAIREYQAWREAQGRPITHQGCYAMIARARQMIRAEWELRS